MYIRSQDGQEVIPLTFATLSIHGNFIHVKPFTGTAIKVAEYDSQEICKKVMDELDGKINHSSTDSFVYRMPSRESMRDAVEMDNAIKILDASII